MDGLIEGSPCIHAGAKNAGEVTNDAIFRSTFMDEVTVQAQPAETRSAFESVSTRIRNDILKGEFQPGEKLKQEDLARRYGKSRAPIRDALIRLDAEGMIRFNSGRHATVTPLDLKEFKEVYQIREALEESAARLAAPGLTDDKIEHLGELAGKMECASRLIEVATWIQLDKEFHLTFYEAGPNVRLIELVRMYWNNTHHFRWAYCTIPGRIGRAENMHRQMLSVMKDRDGETAGILARAHVQESIRGILENQLESIGKFGKSGAYGVA